jgi:hypothetical protein
MILVTVAFLDPNVDRSECKTTKTVLSSSFVYDFYARILLVTLKQIPQQFFLSGRSASFRNRNLHEKSGPRITILQPDIFAYHNVPCLHVLYIILG